MAFFASDNTSCVNHEILTALQEVNSGSAKAYGFDEQTAKLTHCFRSFFDHPNLFVFPVLSGSAANCTALASLLKPYEAIIAHKYSHLQQDECGMPEFFTGGKVLCVSGDHGKVSLGDITSLLNLATANGVHHVRPKAISITQSTECGTAYTAEEIKQISALAKTYDAYLHMDGARFANAIAGLGCSPAEISWKAGVDVLSFGGTKNGAMLAEAVVFFNPDLAKDFRYILKRSGQLASKQRYISIQLLTLLDNELWLRNASHSNAMAKLLQQQLEEIEGVEILFPVEANMVFAKFPKAMAVRLLENHSFYDWPLFGEDVYRLVTSFNTTQAEIEGLIKDCVTK